MTENEVIDIDDSDDSDDSDESDSAVFGEQSFLVTKPSGGRVNNKNDGSIANAEDIPLFVGADKRGLKNAQYLTVYKIDKPSKGYKGQFSLNTTLETIAENCGNGHYTINAHNHKHTVLRTLENVIIDVPIPIEKIDKKQNEAPSFSNDREERDRIERLATLAAKQSIAQSREHTDLVKASLESSIQREREFMQGANAHQQDFFKSMLLMSHQMHEQTMQIVVTALGSQNKNDGVELLIKGIQLAKGELTDDDDSPDWLKALSKGESMLGKLLMLKSNNPTQNPLQNNVQTIPNRQVIKRKPPIDNKELLEVIKLKKEFSRRGIDFATQMRQARESLELLDKDKDNSSEENLDEDSEENKEDSTEVTSSPPSGSPE